MRLADIPAILIEEKLRLWRRRLIVGAIAAVFAIVAVVEAFSAVKLMLVDSIGPVAAPWLLAGVFALAAALAIGIMLYAERRDARATRADEAKRPFGNEKVAVIAEAINLGYSLAQDFRKARAADAASAQHEKAAEKAACAKAKETADAPPL